MESIKFSAVKKTTILNPNKRFINNTLVHLSYNIVFKLAKNGFKLDF
jgi:hypothetical protein